MTASTNTYIKMHSDNEVFLGTAVNNNKKKSVTRSFRNHISEQKSHYLLIIHVPPCSHQAPLEPPPRMMER